MSLGSYAEERPHMIDWIMKNREGIAPVTHEAAEKNVLLWEKDIPFSNYFDWIEMSLSQFIFGKIINYDGGVSYEALSAAIAKEYSIQHEQFPDLVTGLLTHMFNEDIIRVEGGEIVPMQAAPINMENENMSFQGLAMVFGQNARTIYFRDQKASLMATQSLVDHIAANTAWWHDAYAIKKVMDTNQVILVDKAPKPNIHYDNDGKTDQYLLTRFGKGVFSDMVTDLCLSALGAQDKPTLAARIESTRNIVDHFIMADGWESILNTYDLILQGDMGEHTDFLVEHLGGEHNLETFVSAAKQKFADWGEFGSQFIAAKKADS